MYKPLVIFIYVVVKGPNNYDWFVEFTFPAEFPLRYHLEGNVN